MCVFIFLCYAVKKKKRQAEKKRKNVTEKNNYMAKHEVSINPKCPQAIVSDIRRHIHVWYHIKTNFYYVLILMPTCDKVDTNSLLLISIHLTYDTLQLCVYNQFDVKKKTNIIYTYI